MTQDELKKTLSLLMAQWEGECVEFKRADNTF